MKHTKGEWFAKEGQIYPIETGKTLALIPYYDKDDKEQEANAKLIAAAPDMLFALNELLANVGWHHIKPEALQIAKEAISKATE